MLEPSPPVQCVAGALPESQSKCHFWCALRHYSTCLIIVWSAIPALPITRVLLQLLDWARRAIQGPTPHFPGYHRSYRQGLL